MKLFSRLFTLTVTALLSAAVGSAHAAPSDVPLFMKRGAHPNVLLNLSVETPMGGAAYNDQSDGTYTATTSVNNVTGFTECADENGWCSFTGYYDVRYGSGTTFTQITNFRNGASCNNGTFGDPTPGFAKKCYRRAAASAPPATACLGRTWQDPEGDGSWEEYGACYSESKAYLGYFDPKKCYTYSSGRFVPSGATTSTYQCTSKWSGNFLNWAGMTAIDMLIKTMSGGNRTTDTTSETVVQRARKTNSDGWFPYKYLNSSINVAPSTVTPFSSSTLIIYNTDFGLRVGTTRNGARDSSTTYDLKVKVCDSAQGIEGNCVAYGSGTPYYKPEGLIQKHAERMRFAVTSYTLDGDQARDGGVLRSNAKYVGPRKQDSTGAWVTNDKKEWGTDGIFINNPDGVSSGLNSGVVNYLNKFSEFGYKSYDPAGELYYEGLRYFKNLGPTPEYSSGITRSSTDSRCGGFWFANSASEWQDPIQYRCQKNFIIGINDANPWLDKRLPGTHFTTSSITGAGSTSYTLIGNDYGPPSNPDPAINVTTLTNTVGTLEGLNTTWANSGTWTSTGSISSVSGTLDSVGGGIGTYDDSCSDKTVSGLGEVMGTCPYPGKQNSYYIAGLAYYANTTDLRTDLSNKDGPQTISTFFIDSQEFSWSPLDGPRNMLWLAGKYGGFKDSDGDNTNAGSAPDLASEWDENGDGLPDNYVLATQPEKLVSGLEDAFQDIIKRTSTAASLVASSGRVSTNTLVYQAKFNSANWSGTLEAFGYDTNGDIETAATWSASIPAHATRKIFSWNPTTRAGSKFEGTGTNILTSTQLAALDTDTTSGDNSASVLAYLRGDRTNEVSTTNPTGIFRERTSLLGDIINSSPVYVGTTPFNYDALPVTAGGRSVYRAFRTTTRSRTPMVYVGANDGMLHAFKATETGTDRGEEKFAFVPNAAFSAGIKNLSSKGYNHQAFIDGPLSTGDAYLGSAWKTVLVGSMGAGGKSVFALDVTDPSVNASTTTGPGKVMWEFDTSVTGDLGYTLQQATIARMRNGRWAAIFGNGYNSTGGTAKLFIVFLDPDLSDGWTSGTDYIVLGTDSTTSNGLSQPAVRLDGLRTAEAIYAGDLKGNVWKFDVSSATTSSWGSAFTSGTSNVPLFTAKDSAGTVQPITAPLEIGLHTLGGYMLYFGTGKYYEDGDQTSTQVQSFYGIWDKPGAARVTYTTRTDALAEIQILEENATAGARLVSQLTTDIYAGTTPKRGWFMDLKVVGGTAKGERVFSAPLLLDDRLLFSSVVPSTDLCDDGGSSWIMLLSAQNGNRTATSNFDMDDDGDFDGDDKINAADGTSTVVSGVSTEGVVSGIMFQTKGDKVSATFGTSDGNKDDTGPVNTDGNKGSVDVPALKVPRASWRELQ